MSAIRTGDTFQHRFWLDRDDNPLQCIVTTVRKGRVYWKRQGAIKAEMHFDLNESDLYITPNTLVFKSKKG